MSILALSRGRLYGWTSSGASGAFFASPFSLEVLNIKPAGTGTPVLPSTNRIFHAYPGLEYNIRAAVIGGTYPYTFALSGQPSGMTVDSTGMISWPNPTTDSGTITLTVTDHIGAQVTAQWVVTVHTSGFWFVDGDYAGGSNDGSITHPYTTMNALAAGAQGHPTDIVYIKQTVSPYTPTKYPASGISDFTANSFHLNYYSATTAPETLLAYPGQHPVLDFANTYYLTTTGPYIDGITLKNGAEYLLCSSSVKSYQTVRRSVFDTVASTTSTNNNQGGWFVTSDGYGYKFVIQDNEATNFTGADGIGSLYAIDTILIEDNYTHDGGQAGMTPYATPISLKNLVINWTFRHNRIIIPSGARRLEMYDSQSGGYPCDFSYNLVMRADDADVIEWSAPTSVSAYRNTIIGGSVFNPYNAGDPGHTSAGPYDFQNNVIQGTSWSGTTYVTETNDLRGAWGAGYVDAIGNLQGTYRTSYLYQRGWELA